MVGRRASGCPHKPAGTPAPGSVGSHEPLGKLEHSTAAGRRVSNRTKSRLAFLRHSVGDASLIYLSGITI